VDNHNEIRDFLTSRRAKITPEQAGLPAYGGGRRRVPGLRREEVALLAGVSVDYYTRLERGILKVCLNLCCRPSPTLSTLMSPNAPT
jgi:hypothetical protein